MYEKYSANNEYRSDELYDAAVQEVRLYQLWDILDSAITKKVPTRTIMKFLGSNYLTPEECQAACRFFSKVIK